MIGVIVTFSPDHQLDRSVVAKIAAGGPRHVRRHARSSLEGVHDRSSRTRRRATSTSGTPRRRPASFFSDALVERVTGLYGVKPIVEFVDVLALVDNADALTRDAADCRAFRRRGRVRGSDWAGTGRCRMIASVHLADVGVRVGARRSPARLPPPGRSPACATPTSALAAPLGGSVVPVAAVRPRRARRVLGRRRRARPVPRRPPARGEVRVGLARAARAAARVRHVARPAAPTSRSDAQRRARRSGRGAHARPAARESSCSGSCARARRPRTARSWRPGLTWATGLARPPSFVATCSLWESTRALSTYAYGTSEPAHPDAIAERRGEAVPPRAGVHPLPPVRRARPPRRQEPPRRSRALADLAAAGALRHLSGGARRSTRPSWPVSFMPVSVRSAWRMRQASMRCA